MSHKGDPGSRRFAAIISAVFWLAASPLTAEAEDGLRPSRPAPLAASTGIVDMIQVTMPKDAGGEVSRLIAVGTRGHILISGDHGASWRQAVSPSGRLLTSVAEAPGGTLWATGHDAVILRSTDAGESWSLAYSDVTYEAPLLDITFLSAQLGYALGAYGLFLETRDGGESWQPRIIDETEPHFYELIRLKGSPTLVLAGEFGTLLRSPDAGGSWEILDSPYEGTLFGVTEAEDRLFTYGLQGNLFMSTDRGDSWTRIENDAEAGLYGAVETGTEILLFVGQGGIEVRLAPDAESGLITAAEARRRPDRQTLSGALRLRDGSILAYGPDGFLRLPETADTGS